MVILNDTLISNLETYLTQRQQHLEEIQQVIQGHYNALAELEDQLKGHREDTYILTQALGIVQSNGYLPNLPAPEPVALEGDEEEAPSAPFPSDETHLERCIRLLGEAQGPQHVKDLETHFINEGRPASYQSIQSSLDRHIRGGGTKVMRVAPSLFCLPKFVASEKRADAEGNQDQRWGQLIAWELRNVAKPMHLNDIAGRLRRAGTPIDTDSLHRVTADPEGIFERTGQKFVALRSWRAATATA